MNKNLFIFFLGLLLSSFTYAQSSEDKAVAAAVEKLRLAMVNPDKNQLDEIIAPELSYGHSGGKVEDKASFIEALTSGKSDFVEITLTDQVVTVVGSTAIVRHNLTAKTNDAGKEPGTVHLNVLLVWTKKGKDWKLLARQAVKVQS